MLRFVGLTISAPLPQGVTTRVRFRGTSATWPVAAAAVGAGAAGAVAAAVVGAAWTAVGALVAAAAGGAVAAGAAGGAAWGALVHAAASKTRPTPTRAKGCLRSVTTMDALPADSPACGHGEVSAPTARRSFSRELQFTSPN